MANWPNVDAESFCRKVSKLSHSSLRLRRTAAMEEVVQEEPSGAGLAEVKSDAYGDLGAKAFLSGRYDSR